MALPLRLHVTDYQNDTRWRFRLDDGRGAFLADHEVNLGYSREVFAWRDLPGHLRRYRPVHPEEELLSAMGEWLGRVALGRVGEALAKQLVPPVTVVEMHVPAAAQSLLFRPFELAHVGGKPLAAAGARLVYRLQGPIEPRTPKPAGDPFRILAVFSLPSEEQPLDLRRERAGLEALVAKLRQTQRVGVELRVLQYGTTREVLRGALAEGEGWDLVHFSGHGLEGQFLLENEKGEPDSVDATELSELLRPAGERLKLLVLSACLPGAASLPGARRALGLDEEQRRGAEDELGEAATRLPSLGHALAEELDCAVVAMRYSVGNDFARESLLALYDRLLDKRRSLPAALQFALKDSLWSLTSPRRVEEAPPLALATPILLGARAPGLRLRPPEAPAGESPGAPGTPEANAGLAGFPPPPVRFVGRLLPMLAANRALAPESGGSGVLFHGTAGMGKTSCALELAYRHERGRFTRHAWYEAPGEGEESAGALAAFAATLERQLGSELKLVDALESPEDLQRALPRLQAGLERLSLLLVIDKLEGLLGESGGWRDARWGELLGTLLGHGGLSRLILTSSRLPADLAGPPRLEAVPVPALSLDESVLLAQDLPGLSPLFHKAEGRRRLRRILAATHGHPQLLELAAARQQEDPAGLDRLVMEEEGRGGDPRFFAEGKTGLRPVELARTLKMWSKEG